jgi:hypothetical protein
MIAEAREIRENQSYRSNAAASAGAGAKQNHADESVSRMSTIHVNERIPENIICSSIPNFT